MSRPDAGGGAPVLVTGASGFVAAALVDRLRRAGRPVSGVARRTGPCVDRRVGTYADLTAGDGTTLVHLAQPNALPADAEAARDAARGAQDLVAALAERFGQKMVYASSGVVYGDRHGKPVAETDVRNGRGAYAEMKILCEDIVLAAGGVVARLGNTIGPGMAASTVPAEVAAQLRDGPAAAPITVRRLDVARDWIAVEDAVSALAALSDPSAGNAPVAGAYNIGTGVARSIAEIAAAMRDLAGQNHRPLAQTAPAGRDEDISSITLDAARLTAHTSWRPELSLEDCLTRYLKAEGISTVCVK